MEAQTAIVTDARAVANVRNRTCEYIFSKLHWSTLTKHAWRMMNQYRMTKRQKMRRHSARFVI